jgi:hypothetical protein
MTKNTLMGKALHSLLETYAIGDVVKVTPELHHYIEVRYNAVVGSMRDYPHLGHRYLEKLTEILSTEVLQSDFISPYTLTEVLDKWIDTPNYVGLGYDELLGEVNDYFKTLLDDFATKEI